MKTKISIRATYRSRRQLSPVLVFCTVAALLSPTPSLAVPDLWIREDAADTGVEPNTSSSLIYLSDDIWVRTSPDPSYDPTPFPIASPTWTPLPHQNPCYRDCKTSSPNYLYIRVRNRGSSSSLGTESLHAYWAKASTGLTWPSDWKDHMASPCGVPRLYGQEITKPRKNGATASAAEKAKYVAATQAIDTASYILGGATYFDKQNLVHLEVTSAAGGGTGLQVAHSNIRFFSWHREMISRYECLLQEADPTVTLLYWDWKASPNGTITGAGGYMGASTGAVGLPFSGWGVTRALGGAIPVQMNAATETSILSNAAFATFRTNLEGQPHNTSHCYVGGTTCNTLTGARDPMFFHIHANVDRLWSKWQRAQLSRWRPSTAYDVSQSNANLTADLQPWAGGAAMSPWLNQIPGDPNGYQIFKKSTSRSIIAPPIYDDVPLTIPVLAPGQACIIEIPFYPPQRNECPSFSDPGHLCFLARIETGPSPGFGMTSPEVSFLPTNVVNNNNIAWKNTALDDCNVGPFAALLAPGAIGNVGQLVRAVIRTPGRRITLRFGETVQGQIPLATLGRPFVRFDAKLMNAWSLGGGQVTGAQLLADGQFAIDPEAGAQFHNIEIGEDIGSYTLQLMPHNNYPHPQGQLINYDVVQLEPNAVGALEFAGGQRHVLNLNKLVQASKEGEWYVSTTGNVPAGWPGAVQTSTQEWIRGQAPFATQAVEGETRITLPTDINAAYFARTFDVADPSIARNIQLSVRADDGVAVYLNGALIHQDNLPAGGLQPATPALQSRNNLQAHGYRTVLLDTAHQHLLPGSNLLTVELHRALGDGASFDLELALNGSATLKQHPQVEVVLPRTLYQTGEFVIPTVETIAAPGHTTQLMVNGGNPISVNGPVLLPNLEPGTHHLTGIVTDPDGAEQRALTVIQVVPNLPPVSEIHLTRHTGGDLHVHTQTSDPVDGTVSSVRFFIQKHGSFGDPIQLVGTSTTQPFDFTLPSLTEPGEYMVWAEAIDSQGASTLSEPGHLVIPAVVSHDSLVIKRDPASPLSSFLLEWNLPGSTLFESNDLIQWTPVRGAVSPFPVETNVSRRLFRVESPTSPVIHNH